MKGRQSAKLRRWAWPDPLYDTSVFLLRGEGADALVWMAKTFDATPSVGTFTGAKTIWVEHEQGCALVLWFPPWFHTNDGKYLSVLAHESFHAAEFVLRERGMTLTDSSDEAYAYYIAWMFRECYRRLSK